MSFAPSAPTAGAMPAPSAKVVIAVCTLAAFVVALDTTALYVAFPAITDELADTTVERLSWVLNAYTVVYGALLVIMGRLADQVGRRRAFVVGLALFGVSSLVCAATSSAALLIAARAVQGAGSATLIPSSLALALEAVPASRRNVVAALWSATAALASAVGPSLGALLVALLSWRAVFLLNVPVVVLAIAAARRIPESSDPRLTDWPRWGPALLLVIGSTLLGLALVEGRSLSVAGSMAIAVIAALVLTAFVVTELRAPAPSFDLGLFRAPTFAVANLAMLIYGVGFSAMFLGFVLFLTRAWGYDVLSAGLAISPGPITVVPVALAAGRAAARVGHRPLVVAGGVATAIGAVAIAMLAGSEPSFVWRWLPAAIVTGIGVGLVMPTLNGAAVSTLAPERFGIGSAMHQAVRQIGSVLGVALAVVLSMLEEPFVPLFCAVAGCSLATAAIALALPAKRP